MVNEEKAKQMASKETKTAEDTGKGFQSETISELDRADQIAERQKRENDRREAILTREENLEARRRIGGTTEAAQAAQPALSEEEKASQERIMAIGKATGAKWAMPKEEIK